MENLQKIKDEERLRIRNLEKQELTSKLQARDEIDRIINEYSRDFENID